MNGLGLEGMGTELGLINLAAILGVIWRVIILPYLQVRGLVKVKKNKTTGTVIKKPGNPGPRPGDAAECKENGKAIIRLETKVEAIEKSLTAIFRKLDKL